MLRESQGLGSVLKLGQNPLESLWQRPSMWRNGGEGSWPRREIGGPLHTVLQPPHPMSLCALFHLGDVLLLLLLLLIPHSGSCTASSSPDGSGTNSESSKRMPGVLHSRCHGPPLGSQRRVLQEDGLGHQTHSGVFGVNTMGHDCRASQSLQEQNMDEGICQTHFTVTRVGLNRVSPKITFKC